MNFGLDSRGSCEIGSYIRWLRIHVAYVLHALSIDTGVNLCGENLLSTRRSAVHPLAMTIEIVPGVSLKNRGTIREKTRQRSRIHNGSMFLPKTDGRSIWARIMRDTFECLLVHCGGADFVSETQRLVARRIGTLEAELVFMEDKFAATRATGGEPDPVAVDLYGRLADRQRRLADPLGWQRTPRDVTPDPLDYAREQEQEPA